MSALFHQIQREIAVRLGLPSATDVPLVFFYSATSAMVRVPRPEADALDNLAYGETKDIVAEGATIDEAIENVCSTYWRVESENPSHKILKERKNHILQ